MYMHHRTSYVFPSQVKERHDGFSCGFRSLSLLNGGVSIFSRDFDQTGKASGDPAFGYFGRLGKLHAEISLNDSKDGTF